jgi:uncharacterized protein (DUF58 family)
METSDLLKKVRKIEIKTRGLSKNIFAGEYHSAFKGRGMTFSEVREYLYGDDIRNIDWNVTARFNHPYVKVYEEERELTVMLLVDVSGSNDFGTCQQLKNELITELAAVLSFSAIQNNDKIGVIMFSDVIEKFIPPKKGRQHILRIIRELIDYQPKSRQTNVSEALRYLTNVIKKRSIAFVISDFMDINEATLEPNFDEAIRIANKKHDVVALRMFDRREQELPAAGLLKVKDAETGHYFWMDTAMPVNRKKYREWWSVVNTKLRESFLKGGVDHTALQTDKDYVKPLINLFKRR